MITDRTIAHDKSLDNTLDLLRDGYLFIKNKTDYYGCDTIEIHLLGEKLICMSGEDAGKVFYNEDLFERKNAAPKRIQKTLFGVNAIQSLDGEEHVHRKLFFITMMNAEHQKELANLTMDALQTFAKGWQYAEKIVLFDEMKNILCKVACSFSGVPLQDAEVMIRADDFSAMIDGFGGIGPRHWKGRLARNRTEEWMKGIIEDVRIGKLNTKEGSPLYKISNYREIDGKKLDSKMAAIELINIIRPIVAISTYVTFEALALYEHPELKKKLISNDNNYIEMFVQEVRRYYPFTPFIGARVRKDFSLNEIKFKKGMLVLLDIYGIEHDSKVWNKPDEFIPERFKQPKDKLFKFIPQGGGDPAKGHRCPGEGITIEIMKTSLDFLVNKIEFEVPKQNLKYDLARIPTLPESGFIIDNVKVK